VTIRKSDKSRLGEAVWLRFIITQHSRDEKFIINGLINYLGCGRYFSRSNKDYGELIVEKFSDIIEKIIPFFEKYQLQGVKRDNFEDFKKVASGEARASKGSASIPFATGVFDSCRSHHALLMKSKAHLTQEGLEEIRKIKSGMNSRREYLKKENNPK
jgi:hypothetical protein